MNIDKELERAAAILKNGGVVAFPTETVYGLCANVYNAMAVARIFEIKRRPRFDPLIVHVGDIRQSESLASDYPEIARRLVSAFWPGPLTFVLRKSEHVPDIVTAGLPTVAVRMPDHPLALALIRKVGAPLAAPSANLFGYLSPTTAEHVRSQLGRDVDMTLDGGPCRVGVESTIMSLLDDMPVLLRAGGLPIEDIESVIGPVRRSNEDRNRPIAPGQFGRHYAPQTPMILREDAVQPLRASRIGLLAFRAPDNSDEFAAVEVLSPTGDLREAAANLFAALHRLDVLNLDIILADRVPNTGLGLAINDRLRRAANSAATQI